MKVLLNCSDTSLKVCFNSPYFQITRHSFELFHSSALSELLHHYAQWTEVIADNCWDHLHENIVQHDIAKHFKILYNDDNWNILSIFLYIYFFTSLIFIILSKRHTLKVSVLTEENFWRIIIIPRGCRVAQRSHVLLDSLIHWVILWAIFLIYNK